MCNKLYFTLLTLGLFAALPNITRGSTIESAVDVTGLTGAVGLAYGDHTVNAGTADIVDVDNYTFEGKAGDALRLVVSTTTAGFDPELVLRDPTGAILQTVSCNGNSGPFGRATRCSAVLDQTLSTTGGYFLNLSDLGANEIGDYSLHLETYPPTDNWTGFAYDTPVNEALGHLGDMDFLAFNGTTGTGVQVTLSSLTGGLDPNLEIWDPLGNLVENISCNGNAGPFGRATLCSVAPELTLTETGIYKVGLNDLGWNELGDYQLGVSCLFGNCPSAAPSAVPIPAAIWLFGSGLLGFVTIARRKNV